MWDESFCSCPPTHSFEVISPVHVLPLLPTFFLIWSIYHILSLLTHLIPFAFYSTNILDVLSSFISHGQTA